MSRDAKVAVITVFHNSELFFDRYVEALRLQTRPPDEIILVDSGSDNSSYLNRIEASGLKHRLEIHGNIGFCKGNNLGYVLARDAKYIFFLNPDAFPQPNYIEECVNMLESTPLDVGAVSGALLGFDIYEGIPTGVLDSTGIVSTWYGRLIDRDQGEPESALARYSSISDVPALCGAAMFCKRAALESVSANGMVFDEFFFAYKEDIDLSWRLRRAGCRLLFLPSSRIFHCRGWKLRREIPARLRVLSARNEVRLYGKHRSWFLGPALLKYILVRLFNI